MAISDRNPPVAGNPNPSRAPQSEGDPVPSLQVMIQNQDSPKKLTPSSETVKSLLRWWSVQENLTPPFTNHLFTNTSLNHWEANFKDSLCGKEWDKTESQRHSNCLEMRAFRLALSHFSIPPLCSVLGATDIITLVAYINKVEGWGQGLSPYGSWCSLL